MEIQNKNISWEEHLRNSKHEDKNDRPDALESGNQLTSESQVSNQLTQNQWVVVGAEKDVSEAKRNGVESGGKNIRTTESVDVDTSSEVGASKLKMDEELQALRQEKALLLEELESAKSELQTLKHKKADQQNVPQQCKIVFELSFPNDEGKAEVMKIVGCLPGITSINLDLKEKKLSLKGDELDPLLIREELKNICNAKLVSFYVYERKKEEKKEEIKKEERMPYYPYPRAPPVSPDYYNHGAAAMAHLGLKKGGILFFAVLLLLLLVRFAP